MRLIDPNKVFDPLITVLLIIAGVGILSLAVGIWNIAREKSIETETYKQEEQTISPASTQTIDDYGQEEGLQEGGMEEEPEGEFFEILNTELVIIDKFVTWGYKRYSSSREVDAIIIHSAYDALGDDPYSVDGVIEEFRIYKVSPHYLIDREGDIYQLVSDDNIAYHAGAGKMPDGRSGINNFSIGIELIYHKLESPNEVQYQSLARLVKHKAEAYKISSANIVGHKEIDPDRKTDPWNFDWKKFEKMIEQF